MKKRVLMMSHGITGATGFSNQLWLQSRALIEDDYDVYVVHRDYRGEPIHIEKGMNLRLNGGKEIDGMTILPIGGQQWGEDVIPVYLEKYKIDYIHTLGDIWCYQWIAELRKQSNFKWLAHYVFDTENMVSFWNDSIRNADIAVVPAKFALELVKSYGHTNIKYIPHGIDTNIFKPCTEKEKKEFRNKIGIPENAFVIGMVAHNQFRKKISRLLKAFEIFVKNGNRDSILLLHCLPKDINGWDLPLMAKDFGILNNVMFTDKSGKGISDIHVTQEMLRELYCSMDIHALSTGGEGFGIPLVESMACGIPTVAPAYTTPVEFFCEKDKDGKYINERGFAVPYVDIDYHHTGGIWCHVDIAELAKTFMHIRKNYDEAKRIAMQGKKFVCENYNLETIKNKWKELYNNFENIIKETKQISAEEYFNTLKAVRIR